MTKHAMNVETISDSRGNALYINDLANPVDSVQNQGVCRPCANEKNSSGNVLYSTYSKSHVTLTNFLDHVQDELYRYAGHEQSRHCAEQ
jgi:hypothetical protein